MADPDWDDFLGEAPASAGTGGQAPADWDSFLGPGPLPQAVAAAPTEGTTAKRAGALAGNALITGTYNLLGIPGTIGKLLGAPPNSGYPADETVYDPFTGATSSSLPTGAELEKLTGIGKSQSKIKPQNALEHGIADVAEAVPTAAALYATGPLGVIGSLGTAVAGNVAADTAEHYFPDVPWAPIAAGTVASIATGGGFGMASKYAAAKDALKEAAEAEGQLEATRQAAFEAKNAGAPGTPANALVQAQDAKALSVRHLSDRVDQITAASQARLDSTKQLAQAGQDVTGAITKQTFEGTAGKLGKSTTLQQAGEVGQAAGTDWKTNVMPVLEKAVADPLSAALPDSSPATLSNFSGVVSKLGSRAGTLQQFANVLTKDQLQSLNRVLSATGEAAELSGETAGPLTAPVGDVRALRTSVGEALREPQLAGNKNLQAVYAALSNDIGGAAEAAGPDAANAWKTFNAEETRLHEFRDGPLSRLISTTNSTKERVLPGVAVDGLLSEAQKDGTNLASLRTNLPKAADEIAAYTLRQPGLWEKLAPEAQAALVPDEATRANLGKALEAQRQAGTNAKTMVENATQSHADTVTAAKADAKAGNWEQSQALVQAQRAKAAADYQQRSQVRAAQQRLAQAKGAIAPEPSPSTVLQHAASSGMGAYLANHLAGAAAGSPALSAALEFGGAAVPAIYRGVKSLLARPGNLTVPGAGVVAGQNALTNPGQ